MTKHILNFVKEKWHSREAHIYLLHTSCFITKWIIKIGSKFLFIFKLLLMKAQYQEIIHKACFPLLTLWLEWWKEMNKSVFNLWNRLVVKVELAAEEQHWVAKISKGKTDLHQLLTYSQVWKTHYAFTEINSKADGITVYCQV